MYDKIIRKNLESFNVLLSENKYTKTPDPYLTLDSIPMQFGLGRNLVRFKLNLTNILYNSEIEFEAYDKKNEPIYVEKLIVKDNYNKYISLNIEDIHSNGQATLIAIFSANKYPNGVIIDPQFNFENKFNVRYKYPIYINKNIETESEIYFEEDPIISVSEFQVNEYNYYKNKTFINTISSGRIKYVYNGTTPIVLTNFDIFNFNRNIPDINFLSINSILPTNTNGYTFEKTLLKIKDILNYRTLVLENPVFLKGKYPEDTFPITEFESTNFKLEYSTYNTGSFTNVQSYIRFNLNNFKPKTGKIEYVNVRATALHDIKSEQDVAIMHRVQDLNLLVDKSLNYYNNNIDSFETVDIANKYFTVKPVNINNKTTTTHTYGVSLDIGNEVLYNSLYATYNYIGGGSSVDYFEVSLRSQYSMDFYPGEYIIEFDYVGKKDIFFGTPNVKILLSGSAFKRTDTMDGSVIGEIIQTEDHKNHGRLKYTFSATQGNGVLKFLYYGGANYIRDIQIKPSNTANVVSSIQTIDVPINLKNKNETIAFNLEFLNKNGLNSNINPSTKLKIYTGSGQLITSKTNLLYGEMTLSSFGSQGIILGGDRKGSYIFSRDFNTTNARRPYGSGFLLFDYSGSTTIDKSFFDTSINSNVGMDLYSTNGNFLRFRADGSRSGIDINSNAMLKMHRLSIDKLSGEKKHYASILSGSEVVNVLCRVTSFISGTSSDVGLYFSGSTTKQFIALEGLPYGPNVNDYIRQVNYSVPEDGFLIYEQPHSGAGQVTFFVQVANPDKEI